MHNKPHFKTLEEKEETAQDKLLDECILASMKSQLSKTHDSIIEANIKLMDIHKEICEQYTPMLVEIIKEDFPISDHAELLRVGKDYIGQIFETWDPQKVKLDSYMKQNIRWKLHAYYIY